MGRLLVATSLVAAAITAQVGMASPASAMYSRCLNHVKNGGYVVGPKVYSACSHQATKLGWQWIPHPTCVTGLGNLRVPWAFAMDACSHAHG
ncbi:hypothetical protein GCM10022244_22820 [Streptomyces gulbargensis]|uniref:Secreted protein n=1 Tax=Streptomyces gulbargensis TaxID=364901 RepID=A0ABP7M4R3_9ACTN